MIPTQEQIDIAAMWLESNEGNEGGEREACVAVADWIKQWAFEKMLRSEAKLAGITVSDLRRRLAAAGQNSQQPHGSESNNATALRRKG